MSGVTTTNGWRTTSRFRCYAGCQLISTLRQSTQKRSVGVCNEARIIGESSPHSFRQLGFKVHPLSSELVISASMHIAWALRKRTRKLRLALKQKTKFARLIMGPPLGAELLTRVGRIADAAAAEVAS
jgi:hypothetical protein